MTDENSMNEAARRLRKRQTEAEKRLWFKLRDRQLNGIKFRRQEPVAGYIVDFVCYEHKIIVEIDGSPHKKREVKMNDISKAQWFKSEKYKVLRFWNSEITNNLDSVIEKIRENLSL